MYFYCRNEFFHAVPLFCSCRLFSRYLNTTRLSNFVFPILLGGFYLALPWEISHLVASQSAGK